MDKNKNDSKPVILIVDDQPRNIRILSEYLKDEYTLRATTNGLKAIDIAVSEKQPDLILLDIMMPEMDGYEVCRHLKKSDRARHIPIIFLTAKNRIEDETIGFEVGAVDFLTKPFHPDRLKARLRAHLKTKQYFEREWNPKEQARLKSGSEHDTQGEEMYLEKMQHQIDSAVDSYRNLIELRHRRYKFDLSWRQQSVADLGGDFLDIREEDDTLSILVADVAGHDMGSSYYTILLKAFFDENCHKDSDGVKLFETLNRHLMESGKDERMITALFTRICLHERSCQIVSAAHPLVVMCGQDASSAPKRIFKTGGTPLGIQERATFISERIQLRSGDRLFIHTDGVPNVSRLDTKTGERKKLYSKGLDDLILKYRDHPLDEALSMVWHDLLRFCRGKPKDDILLFGLDIP